MIELPEAMARAKELNDTVLGKTIAKVHPPSSPHKFCWYHGDVEGYAGLLNGNIVQKVSGFGIFVEMELDRNVRLCFNDGTNIRLCDPQTANPKKYQLLIEFTDGWSLVFTVAMYGGIICYDDAYDNEYYIKSAEGISPLHESFDRAYFEGLFLSCKPTMSAKAFLATEQRIPGLGNGTLQDILFQAGVHPKRKIQALTQTERDELFYSIKAVLKEMTECGGRDTEKDIFGSLGGYHTLMSKNTINCGCPRCRGTIVKENFLGGSVYYCPNCQPL